MRALLLLLLLFTLPAFAVGPSCPKTSGVNDSQCPPDENGQKEQSCVKACKKAKKSCDKAQQTCSTAKTKDAQDAAKGANDANNAGDGASGKQGQNGTQAPNADNMCAGQQANQNRSKDNSQVPGDEMKCAEDAGECRGFEEMAVNAQTASTAFTSYIGSLDANAAQMGQQCQKSKDNESKMPQMPQIPQMPKNDQKGDSGSGLTDTNGNLDTGTSTDTNSGATKQVESVNFGDPGPGGGVSATQTTPPSGISGSQAPGFSSGAGATGLQPATNSGTTTPTGGGFGAGGNYASGGGSGAALGSGGTDGKSSNGIAAADIKPESSNVGEINYGSGGKSVLGLKGGHGGDDEEKVDPKDPVAKAIADAKREPSAAGAANSSAAAADDGTSLFTMIRNRIRNLKELGAI